MGVLRCWRRLLGRLRSFCRFSVFGFLLFAFQGGLYTPFDLVVLCVFHQGQVRASFVKFTGVQLETGQMQLHPLAFHVITRFAQGVFPSFDRFFKALWFDAVIGLGDILGQENYPDQVLAISDIAPTPW